MPARSSKGRRPLDCNGSYTGRRAAGDGGRRRATGDFLLPERETVEVSEAASERASVEREKREERKEREEKKEALATEGCLASVGLGLLGRERSREMGRKKEAFIRPLAEQGSRDGRCVSSRARKDTRGGSICQGKTDEGGHRVDLPAEALCCSHLSGTRLLSRRMPLCLTFCFPRISDEAADACFAAEYKSQPQT